MESPAVLVSVLSVGVKRYKDQRKASNWRLAYNIRSLAHNNHGREYGGTHGTGTVIESYILILRLKE